MSRKNVIDTTSRYARRKNPNAYPEAIVCSIEEWESAVVYAQLMANLGFIRWVFLDSQNDMRKRFEKRMNAVSHRWME